MVNYCCVKGCGRNTRTHPNLTYYSLPREKERQHKWLKAAHREDLLSGPDLIKPGHRICSRHFEVGLFKNRNRMLGPNAAPTLCLNGEETVDDLATPSIHKGFECDNCQGAIIGFRYRCIECEDYDLCHKCEVNECHSGHFVLRIPRPNTYKKSKYLKEKLKKELQLHKAEPEANSQSSDDDEPIQKYKVTKQNGRSTTQNGGSTNVNNIDLDKNIKVMLQLQVNMALKKFKEDNKGVYKQFRFKKRNY